MQGREDIAGVLARLKEEVRRRRPEGAELPLSERAVTLRRVYATMHVNPHLPIGWPKMPSGILPKIVAITQKVVRRLLRWYINPIIEQQNAYNSAATAALEMLVMQMEQLEKMQEIAKLRLQRLERSAHVKKAVSAPSIASAVGPQPMTEERPLDYFQLELKFRGPQLLKERQKAYLKYFQGRQNVLDIGCGRGEFVEMLTKNGISARGIDLDADAVAYARARGVPVELAEAIAYLESLPDESLGGVFAAQVIEHLPPHKVSYLLELCYEKMMPEAPIVLETINPACLWALANWFVIDPTHVWPIHSETLKFLLESAGFWEIKLEFLSPALAETQLLPENTKLNKLDPEAVSLLNHHIDKVNQFLFGFQDYAAIAYRPPRSIGAGL